MDKSLLPLLVVVLDTNVLVSALCLPGSLPAELADVLARPKIVRRFGMTAEKAQAFIETLRELAVIVPGTMTVEAVPDDPHDNHVVACALEGGAGMIVSGDRHLKDIGVYAAVRILSPAEFRAFLLEATGEAEG